MTGQSRRTVLVYLALVFAAGSLFGAAAHRFFNVQGASAALETSAPSPKGYRERLIMELTRDLSLKPGQIDKVHVILNDIGERYHEARKVIKPEIEVLRAERRERIMALLDAPQRNTYQQILDQREREKEQRKKNGKGSH
jgi:hypothetical protein